METFIYSEIFFYSMDEQTIIEILKKWNPWEKGIDAGIKRPRYVKKIYPYLERKEILVLKGIRRAGKSTLVKQLIQELINNKTDRKKILYLNLEDYNFANNLSIDLLEQVLSTYRNYSGNDSKTYFFIDEIQMIDGWERWVRTKYDLDDKIKFVITGSSASLISAELSTLLTGRNLSFKIMPLSFSEFIEFSSTKSLQDYLKFGGFPEVVLENDEEKKTFILQQYFEDIIHKDIIDRYNIRNTRQLINIARSIVSNSSSKVSINKLSKVFGISKDTLSLYITYMINAYLLYEVRYFSFSATIRHDVTKLSKLFALDNGLINAVDIKYSKNEGKLFENAVLIKLLERYDEVSYWSELQSEVDFVVDKKAINVTSADIVPERETKALAEFQKKHKQFSPWLVTKSATGENMVPLHDFLTQ